MKQRDIKILMVLTSNDQLRNTGRILIAIWPRTETSAAAAEVKTTVFRLAANRRHW